ncbi:hypothetical protein [Paeniglutamicibacter kerguelensis]|uniref:Uncharacterized protein n=1 Tax=Paeniglutamicibacter kerguelensis TaxID=254788 RepID=A0ABS4XEB2_9MICC|nr:hypothetical protein [Paeniglutamicibacter kerguelensis]MBP2386809.1 hypothetical protein [Paeniglutamicibacter kerguelensis]
MAEQQTPRPRKSRRYTAPPQTVSDSVVLGVFEMPHGAGRPDPPRPPAPPQPPRTNAPTDRDEANPDEANPAADKQTQAPGKDRAAAAGKAANVKSPGKAGSGPVLPERAAEDDPRRWGDADDDLGEWMRSQRPPHWD